MMNPIDGRPRGLLGSDRKLPVQRVEVLVLGGGVAGFRAAIEAARTRDVLVVTKDLARQSSTRYAQGGVAAVLGPDDSFGKHCEDTLSAGQGLCEPDAVERMVSEAPALIDELLAWGGAFDRVDGGLHLTREGGHSRRRVVHAHGDATGLMIQDTLGARVEGDPRIRVEEHVFVVDLLVSEGRCIGAIVLDRTRPRIVLAGSTILCTGGAGQIYRETTNPRVATGDGLAMAWRAGAELADLEFVQFHPTTFYAAGSARQLITEAVRGEGAHLVDADGERFVFRYHPSGELAPRDVVSRATVQHLALRGGDCVFLDVRHMADRVLERFPGFAELCRLYGLDLHVDRIPVHPSAHYMVGGVVVDEAGRSSIPGLFAAGEVSMSGIHGANRLASNSLLEGLVFGRDAGAAAAEAVVAPAEPGPLGSHLEPTRPSAALDAEDMFLSVKSLTWRKGGILRSGRELKEAVEQLETWWDRVASVPIADVKHVELLNVVRVALLVTRAALWREESRGTHHRADHPERDDQNFRVHSLQSRIGDRVLARPLHSV